MNTPRSTNPALRSKPLWIVQNNGIDRVTLHIARVLREQGRAFVDISVHDKESFQNDLTSRLAEEGLDAFTQPTFFVGSVLMLNCVLASPLYKSLTVFTPENYVSETWTKAHGQTMLNSVFDTMTLGQAAGLKKPVFVRPLNEQKLFTGAVISEESFESWYAVAHQRNSNLSLDSLVCVSHPKEILREWRVLCFNGVPKLWSQYKEGEHLHVEDTIEPLALNFAQRAAAHWVPDALCTLDVAKTPEGYKIVEFNGMHCCGIYKIDPARFIDEVDHYLTQSH